MASLSNQETKAAISEQGLAASGPEINNEAAITPEKASDGAETSLQVGTKPPASTGDGVLKTLIRAPRYFDGYEEKYDEGRPKRWHKRCYICGDSSHEGKKKCKKVNPCFICSKKGHLLIDCPNKKVEVDFDSTPCLKCGKTGHDMFSCTDEYDPEDLKDIECYICKQVGHLCCVGEKVERPREVSCYNCGECGHFGLECTKPREVASYFKLSCRKCKGSGQCRKCKKQAQRNAAKKAGATATTKAETRKARNARRRLKIMQRQTGSVFQPNAPPIVGPYHARPPIHYQPNGLPIVGPYHARPPTHNQPNGPPIVGPYHARNPTHNHPNGAWQPPVMAPYYGRPGSNVWLSPAAAAATPNLSHQGGQHVYHNQVRPQAADSFGPLTGFPYQHWRRPQIGTQPPINQETRTMLPQSAMVPNWHFERGTRLLQPHVNQQTGIGLPQTGPGTLQNSTTFGSSWR